MKNKLRNTLLLLGAALLAVLIAVYSMHDGMSVIIDGEQVTGLSGAGYAIGFTLIGILAALLAFMFVSLVLTGVSIVVMIVLALVFFGVLVVLSPLVLPLLFVGGMIWIFARKKTVATA